MTHPKRLLALAVLPAMLLTACGDDSTKSSKSASPSASASASPSASQLAKPATDGKLDDVKVDTKDPKNPKVTIEASKLPFGTKDVEEKVLEEGNGAAIGDKDLLKLDYVMVNGTTGKTIDSSFGHGVTKLDMAQSSSYLPGLVKTIKKHKVGTKVLVSVPAAQAFGKAGMAQGGVGPNDDIVMYLDFARSDAPLTEATGDKKDAPAGMPKVEVPGAGKEAKITVPSGQKAPTSLKQATLIENTKGETVAKGDTIAVHYTGQIWGGKVFDSSAKTGQPAKFAIGTGAVIPGWDKALVGKKVGDRVLIVIPPADGYGAQGQPQAGIKGTDTLVFVVDILADYGPMPQQQG